MMIAGGEGKIRLSIPLQSGRETKQVYKDIKISQEYKWQEQHLKTIVSCYKRSPWFEYYQDSLETLYQTKFMFLWDWNLECLNWVLQKMNMIKDFDIIDLGFSDLENNPFIFRKAIDLPEVKYNQVFQERIGFQSGVSILDLLFCEGKEAVGILRLNKTSGS
jgi:hypothetical protein